MTTPPKANILLVDDHPANLVALMALLKPLGQNLVQATSGEEALKQLLQQAFAVILLDVQMSGMDGFETARMIHSRPASQHVPIIFLTAIHREPLYVHEGYSVGAVDYLLKQVMNHDASLSDEQRKSLQIMHRHGDRLLSLINKVLHLSRIEAAHLAPDPTNPVDPLELQQVYAELEAAIADSPDCSCHASKESFSLLDATTLATMSKGWIAELEDAALLCDDEKVQKLIDQLPTELTPLATCLTDYVNNFQFEPILQLIRAR